MRKLRKDVEKSQKFARELRKDMTEAEHKLWPYLRMKNLGGYRFRRQHPIGPYIADFACVAENLIVELDGATHGEDAEILYDKRRTVYLEGKGWRVARYSNEDVYKHVGDVQDDIIAHLRGLK